MGLDRWRSHGRSSAVAVGTVAVLVALGLLAALALGTFRSDREARAALEDQQAARAGVAAAFVRAYVADVHARASRVATAVLATAPAGPEVLSDVAQRLGAETAALLDAGGRVLANHPSDPAHVGTSVAAVPHVRQALAGTSSVSRVQDSRLISAPVIAFAVPFEAGEKAPFESGASERRVLSAGFRFDVTPIGGFFSAAVTSQNREVVLVDDLGVVVAADHQLSARGELADADPPLAAALDRSSRGTYVRDGDERWFVGQDVEGTPWRVVASLPTRDLYAPVGDLTWIGRALLAAFGVAAVAVGLLIVRLVRMTRRYEHLARIDQLTGVPNRRHLQDALERTAAAGQRHRRPVAVLLIDVDHFKVVNDTHGHKGGDRVLVSLAEQLSHAVRTADLIGRWGGEEFLAVLPDTDADDARTVAERVRERVADLTWPWADVRVTVTVGVGAGTHAADQLLLRADAALYAGKERGRDRVEVVDHALAPELVADRTGTLDLRDPPPRIDLDLDLDLDRPPAPSRRHGGGASTS